MRRLTGRVTSLSGRDLGLARVDCAAATGDAVLAGAHQAAEPNDDGLTIRWEMRAL